MPRIKPRASGWEAIMLPLGSELTFDRNDSTGVVHDQSLFLSKSINQHLLKAKAGLMVSKELAKGSGSYISGKRSFPGRLRFRAVRTPTSKLDTKKKAHVNKLHQNNKHSISLREINTYKRNSI